VYLANWMQKVDLSQEIQEVYLHSFLFKLAEALVAIFIPFYIIDNGFSILAVFGFYTVYYTAHLLGSIPFGILATKIGYKHTSLLSSVFILAFYLMIRGADTEILLYLSALVGGTGFTIYWMGMNPEVATSSDDDRTEEETGFFFSMPSLASMLAPFTGGLILLYFGFNTLFLLAALLMFVSFTPFLLSSEHREGMNMDISELFTRDMAYDILTYFAEGSHSVGEKILWPLYLAIVITGSVNIGTAGTLLALGSAITSIFIGKIVNPQNRARVIIIGAFMAAVTLILMAQITAPATAFVISALHGIVYTAVNLPIYSAAIRRSEQKDIMEYFTAREVSLAMGRLTVIGVAAGLYMLYPEDFFVISFAVVAAGSLLTGYFGGKIRTPET